VSGWVLGLAPILVVALGALLLMLAEAFGKPAPLALAEGASPLDSGAGRTAELSLGATVVLFAGAVSAVAVWLVGPEALPGVEKLSPHLIIDRFSLFAMVVLCLGGGLSALLAGGYLPEHKIDRGEFFPLLLLSTVGAMALVAAGEILTLFVALETMSLGVYCLVGLRRQSPRSSEAALKYFLLGSFASALLLLGMALLYGATGRLDFAGIGEAVRVVAADGSGATVPIALGLMLTGFAFKVSAVPFHMWAPDAYEGAPTPTTTYMAVAVKTAAFVVMVRVLLQAFGDESLVSWASGWPPVVAALAVLSMTIANLIAGRQESIKRMLAYSSVAHAGYILVGVAALSRSLQAEGSVLFYLLAYTVSTAGAFGALIWAGHRGAEAVSYEDVSGLGKRNPVVALAFSLFLLSLAGVPPTAGFFGKLYVFQAAVDAGLYKLVVIGLLNSVLGAYYYLKVIVHLYMREPQQGAPRAVPMQSSHVAVAVAVSALLVAALGLLPDAWVSAAALAVQGRG
jgi:NADH-quinone oxidoreductase subunit N